MTAHDSFDLNGPAGTDAKPNLDLYLRTAVYDVDLAEKDLHDLAELFWLLEVAASFNEPMTIARLGSYSAEEVASAVEETRAEFYRYILSATSAWEERQSLFRYLLELMANDDVPAAESAFVEILSVLEGLTKRGIGSFVPHAGFYYPDEVGQALNRFHRALGGGPLTLDRDAPFLHEAPEDVGSYLSKATMGEKDLDPLLDPLDRMEVAVVLEDASRIEPCGIGLVEAKGVLGELRTIVDQYLEDNNLQELI